MNQTSMTPPKPRWPRNVRRLLLFGLSTYLAIVVMLAFLQRAMIYLPARQSRIDPQDAGLPVGRVHTITLKTEDGLELYGWHLLPRGHTAADRKECDGQLALGRPVVLYFSGNAGNRAWRIQEFEVFTRLGCDVFVFDYRGYGENPGSPSEDRLAADATAAWRYATQTRRIEPRRMILCGESLGGGVAVRLAAEQCAGRHAARRTCAAGHVQFPGRRGRLPLSLAARPLAAGRSLRVGRVDAAGDLPDSASARPARLDHPHRTGPETVRCGPAAIRQRNPETLRRIAVGRPQRHPDRGRTRV